MPYTDEMNLKGNYIYPSEIENKLDNSDFLMQEYRFDSNLDIDSISSEKVITAFSQHL
jgi:hypothetical protein